MSYLLTTKANVLYISSFFPQKSEDIFSVYKFIHLADLAAGENYVADGISLHP